VQEWGVRHAEVRSRTVRTARLQLRPIIESDLDALVELDAVPAARDVIDPFGEHIPADPVERREYERRLVGNPGSWPRSRLHRPDAAGRARREGDSERAAPRAALIAAVRRPSQTGQRAM
jgi:hypothetical protein